MAAQESRAASAERGVAPESAAPYRPGYELVAERLLQYIAEQDLRPGDRLPTEQGLADALDATRNVTREALKVLAAMGRVSVRKGAGIFVAASSSVLADEQLAHFQPTDMEHVLMLLDYRRLIESDTARRAATLATPIEVKAIRESAERSIVASTADNVDEFARADAQFHDSISAASHNVFLQSGVVNIRRFAAQTDTLLFHGDVPGSFEVAGRQHLEIANAIGAGDTDLASRLMSEHIDTTQHQFERKIRDRLFAFVRDPDTTP
ncbi:FadR/GntR family transcriptional regulator [Compostimonas suwonensis]|uniref:DNA-binding FadR family transcriptional regulator n=1 Tax=Compostimonas suwonensis TaxID=1048394 RepID=A0A2M9BVM6_9MICO|nr:FCD domain-containing protein [Compostimonas suwonensis]PJJ62003.1 DNA-binding FadR family transcriptional regulator [Compostimonas suwonensis]